MTTSIFKYRYYIIIVTFIFASIISQIGYACGCNDYGPMPEPDESGYYTNCIYTNEYSDFYCFSQRLCAFCTVDECSISDYPIGACTKYYDFGDPETPEEPSNKPPKQCGSVINVGALTVGERVPLVGTDLTLNYHSDRVVGFKDAYTYMQNIDQPTSSSHTVVHVTDRFLEFATTISNDHVPGTYLEHTFTWNGLDPSSNHMYSSTKVQVEVEFGDGFVRWTQYARSMVLGGFQSKVIGLGGWTLSNVHFYDLNKKTLYLGNGDSQQARVYYVTGTGGNYNIGYEVMPGIIPPAGLSHYLVRSGDQNESYLFDLNGFHVKTFSGRTAVEKLNITYDINHKITLVTDAYNNEIEITRSGSTVSIEAPNGKITTIGLDANGWTEEIVDPLNKKYEMAYSIDGLIQTFKNPEGLITSFSYDSMGRLSEDSNNAGHELTFDILSLVPNSSREINSTSKLGRTTNFNINY